MMMFWLRKLAGPNLPSWRLVPHHHGGYVQMEVVGEKVPKSILEKVQQANETAKRAAEPYLATPPHF